MTYIQLFADKAELLEPFDDAERGRLLTAMIAYAFHGVEPELSGNERYIWPVFRPMLDSSASALEGKRTAGRSRKQREAEVSTDEHSAAEVSRAEQNGTDVSTDEQREAEASTDEHSAAKRSIIQESRIMNHESRTKRESTRRFAPPSPTDVDAYASQIGAANVDGERFCDFYASKGWRVGSQPMKDWRAAVRTWAKRDSGGHPPDKPGKIVREQQYSQRTYGQEADKALDAMMAEYTARQGGGCS